MTDTTRYRFEPLRGHDRSGFTCGEPELDRYFLERASQDQRRHVASCFVLVDGDTGEILGYYTLSASTLVASELPEDIARRLPRYPNLPAILLGRLAVSASQQGKGYGKLLLVDSLRRAREVTTQVAALAVVVDAKNERASTFYEGFGFIHLNSSPTRLFLPIGSIP